MKTPFGEAVKQRSRPPGDPAARAAGAHLVGGDVSLAVEGALVADELRRARVVLPQLDREARRRVAVAAR
eukprot:2426350-Prymnesium_polylepis.1